MILSILIVLVISIAGAIAYWRFRKKKKKVETDPWSQGALDNYLKKSLSPEPSSP